MSHLNAGLWNIHKLCVLQVLNEKETILTRKAEKLAKTEISVATKKFYVATGSQ